MLLLHSMKASRIALSLCLFILLNESATVYSNGPETESDFSSKDVMAALQAFDDSPMDDLCFETMEVSGDRIRVMLFDPSRPEEDRQSLLSVNGKAPSEEDFKNFREEMKAAREVREKEETKADGKNAGKEEDQKGVVINKLVKMVKPGSLRLINDKNGLKEYSFVPLMEVTGDLENPQKYFQGRLTFNTNAPVAYVQNIEIENKTSFKPAFGVKINKFKMAMQFDLVLENRVVLMGLNSEVRAKAFLVKKIEETIRIEYRKFRLPKANVNPQ